MSEVFAWALLVVLSIGFSAVVITGLALKNAIKNSQVSINLDQQLARYFVTSLLKKESFWQQIKGMIAQMPELKGPRGDPSDPTNLVLEILANPQAVRTMFNGVRMRLGTEFNEMARASLAREGAIQFQKIHRILARLDVQMAHHEDLNELKLRIKN